MSELRNLLAQQIGLLFIANVELSAQLADARAENETLKKLQAEAEPEPKHEGERS